MDIAASLHQEISGRVAQALLRANDWPHGCWISFFICAPGESAKSFVPLLKRLGAKLDEPVTRGRFYAKLQTRPLCEEVSVGIETLRQACEGYGATLLAVDLDDRADALPTRTVNLFHLD